MKRHSDDQIYQAVTQLKRFSFAGFCLLFVFMAILVTMDRKQEPFESTARYRSPAESQAPGSGTTSAESLPVHPVRGQTIYVPAYSHIYHQDGSPALLAITLSIRNTSMAHELYVDAVDYYDTDGKKVKAYVKNPLRLAPLATTEFLVEQDDTAGGSGANFIVTWVSDKAIVNPIVEAVMIDTKRNQGISFVARGVVTREVGPTTTTEE